MRFLLGPFGGSVRCFAGHSKWHNIKHKKAAQDAKKAKIINKFFFEIMGAVRAGGGEVEGNPKLGSVLERARAAGVPKENVQKALKKATDSDRSSTDEELSMVRYEGYGPSGVAVIIEALTDNKKRTAPVLRHIFSRAGGSLGAQGDVEWMFEHKGIMKVAAPAEEEAKEQLILSAIEAGVVDFQEEESEMYMDCAAEDLHRVKELMESLKVPVLEAELIFEPKNRVPLRGDKREVVVDMIASFEGEDDVQEVFHNAEIHHEDDDREAE